MYLFGDACILEYINLEMGHQIIGVTSAWCDFLRHSTEGIGMFDALSYHVLFF